MDYGKVYSQMHAASEKAFAGYSIKNYIDHIRDLVTLTDAKTLLDYGSGKGYQYLARRVHENWGGILPVCYDVGVRQLAQPPIGCFDGVICTDVMEHIDEPDVDRILTDIFGYAQAFVFLAIACRKSKKILPDGRDVHLTVKPPEWWDAKLATLSKFRPDLIIEVEYDTAADPAKKPIPTQN